MGTIAAVQWKGADDVKPLVEEVKRTFKEIETLLNAHNPDSELSKLAPLSDEEILTQCSPLVRDCYDLAFFGYKVTGGVFNPRWKGPGTMDLGGIAKGYALDIAAGKLWQRETDLPDLLLDLGGSLLVVKGVWTVGIAGMREQLTLTAGQSCATSAEYYRGKHIVDGRTGEAANSGLKSVTVVTRTTPQDYGAATGADLYSTYFFILGEAQTKQFLKTTGTTNLDVYYAGF